MSLVSIELSLGGRYELTSEVQLVVQYFRYRRHRGCVPTINIIMKILLLTELTDELYNHINTERIEDGM